MRWPSPFEPMLAGRTPQRAQRGSGRMGFREGQVASQFPSLVRRAVPASFLFRPRFNDNRFWTGRCAKQRAARTTKLRLPCCPFPWRCFAPLCPVVSPLVILKRLEKEKTNGT